MCLLPDATPPAWRGSVSSWKTYPPQVTSTPDAATRVTSFQSSTHFLEGFTMSDPRDFLNLEQMKLVAKRLALIHATGHDLLQRDLDFVKSSCDIIFETSELGQYLTRNEEVTTTVRSIHLGLVQVAMEMVSQELSKISPVQDRRTS